MHRGALAGDRLRIVRLLVKAGPDGVSGRAVSRKRSALVIEILSTLDISSAGLIGSRREAR